MISDAELTDRAGHDGGGGGTADRDDISEIRKLSQKETFRILLWRIVVTGVLSVTAFAVTFATYRLLVREQHDSFKQGVSYNRYMHESGDNLKKNCKNLLHFSCPFVVYSPISVRYNRCVRLLKLICDNDCNK